MSQYVVEALRDVDPAPPREVTLLFRPTFAVVDARAIRANVAAVSTLLNPQKRLLVAVKADGYGHGAVTAAQAAISGGATDLGVASVEEAAVLRKAGITAPILVLGVSSAAGIRAAARLNVAVTVGRVEEVDEIEALPWPTDGRVDADGAAVAVGDGLRAQAHLKVDTGMSRLGVRTSQDAIGLAERIVASDRLHLAGVFTHLACADAASLAHTEAQIARFREVLAALRDAGIDPGVVHAANSAATLRRPDWHFDMVRVGISAYGYGPAGVFESPVPLVPALNLYSCVTRVETLQPGDTVGYGATFTAPRPMRVATLPVGYADGYFRILSNRASVLLRGERAAVIGNVCMDQLMVDVTHLPHVAVGDCAALYGRAAPSDWTVERLSAAADVDLTAFVEPVFTPERGPSILSLDELADWAGTISYELMCALSPRVPRVVLAL